METVFVLFKIDIVGPFIFFWTWIHYHLFKVIKSSSKMSKYLYVSIQIWNNDNHWNVNIELSGVKLMQQTKYEIDWF